MTASIPANLDNMLDALSAPSKAFLANSDKQMLLNNEWVNAQAGATISTYDPATGQQLGTIPRAAEADVNAAVSSARQAFDTAVWRGKTPAERAKVLWRIGELIDQHIDELAELETLDQGKPLFVGRWAEIPGAAEQFRYFAGLCSKLEGKVIPTSINYQPGGKRVHAYTQKEPVGVVAAIVPWNSPLVLTAMKLAPALCAGCSVILKPSEETSLTAIRLGELCIEAGLPAGVLNIVTGYGHEIGRFLVGHKDVNKISFTGSTESGQKIIEAAKPNFSRVTLELGGKSPMVVFDDADIEMTIPALANAIFFNGGQVCVAGSRLLVQQGVADQVIQGIADIAASMAIGHGLDANTQMGPLISTGHAEKVKGYIDSGQHQGAELVVGGERGGPNGTFISPTVLANSKPNTDIMRDEIFGPVLACTTFDNADDALAIANDSDYGLSASVWTESLSRAHCFADDVQSGTVWINSHLMFDASLPIGGMKHSGWGRESGLLAVENYLETKTVCAVL